ncbi:MAG: hypothetical protein M3Y87_25850, partial [Myxococcota bacterium]|nr:hypothetical protein [Myxococcota bacterium]
MHEQRAIQVTKSLENKRILDLEAAPPPTGLPAGRRGRAIAVRSEARRAHAEAVRRVLEPGGD